MRVVAPHPDVIAFVSDVWQTTCTAVRAGDEGFVIDSPIYPEELRALADVVEQAGFPVSGLLATHGDWDHLLGRLAFPQAALGCPESTAERMSSEPGAAQRDLRDFDAEHYVQRERPLSLGTVQSLPVPGKLELGPAREIELYEATGHTGDGAAYRLPWLGVLVCGDYLSPVEIPMLGSGGSIDAYLQTLERLGALVAEAEWVIPGHGGPIEGSHAAEILEQDVVYLQRLATAPDTAKPPRPRANAKQRQIHAANLAKLEADRAERSACVLWLTGLSAAGKTTIARHVEATLRAGGRPVSVLDGDDVRRGLSRDLGFTDHDRIENIRRVAEVARLMVNAGVTVIVALISPFASQRQTAREVVGDERFFEVFVDAPLEVAKRRDPKGLYRRARAGELANFTGIDSPYEPPTSPDLHLDTMRVSAADAAAAVIEMLAGEDLI